MTIYVATYRRVSTGHQAAEGESLDVQLQRLHAFAQAQGWVVVKDYCDAGFSGAKEDRPALMQLLADAREGRFSKVLVLKLDRLTRSVKHFHTLADELERYGVSIVSVTQNLDTSTPTGRLLRNILVDFAHFERELIQERVREVIEGMAEQGKWYTGRPPFGMVRLASGKVVGDGEKAEIVRELFHIYDSDPTSSITSLAKQFGLSVDRVYRILRNPVYAGYLGFRRRVRLKDGRTVCLDRSAWQLIPSQDIEPIISFELYQRVQRRLKANRFTNPNRNGPKYSIFHRLLRCGVCGSTLVRVGSTAEPDHAYYRCDNRTTRNSTYHVSVRQDKLAEAILEQVDRLCSMDAVWEEALRARSLDDAARQEALARLQSQIDDVDRQIRNLVAQLADGALAHLIRPALLELDQKKSALLAEYEALQQRQALDAAALAALRQQLTSIRAAYRVATWEERRELFALILDHVEVGPTTCRIVWADAVLPPSTIPAPVPLNAAGQPIYQTRPTLESLTDEELLRGIEEHGKYGFARLLGVSYATLRNERIRRGLHEPVKQGESRSVLRHLSDEELLAGVAATSTAAFGKLHGVSAACVKRELKRRGLKNPNRRGAQPKAKREAIAAALTEAEAGNSTVTVAKSG